MPVALARDAWDEWLAPDNHDVEALQRLLVRGESMSLSEHPVSTLVNKVANNVPELIAPLETGAVG